MLGHWPHRGKKYGETSQFCDDGTLEQILYFWTLFIALFLCKTPPCLYFKPQRFGDKILSPSSGKAYSFGPNR
jgi:hypothetical protein